MWRALTKEEPRDLLARIDQDSTFWNFGWNHDLKIDCIAADDLGLDAIRGEPTIYQAKRILVSLAPDAAGVYKVEDGTGERAKIQSDTSPAHRLGHQMSRNLLRKPELPGIGHEPEQRLFEQQKIEARRSK